MHESGAGLYGGVRETLQAARAGKLAGVRGTVAELIDVPAAYDTAIEVALGGHLQDVVVERWADAEAAIAHLKRTGAGRATFQPLDTVRARRAAPARRSGTRSRSRASHGVAAELVDVAGRSSTAVVAGVARPDAGRRGPAGGARLPAAPAERVGAR